MTKTIQNALTLVGAAYILNCGSTVIVELAEGDTATSSSGSGVVSSTSSGGIGGMGGSVAWAQHVAFTTYQLACIDDVWAIVPAETFEPALWPLVQIWSEPQTGPDPELLSHSDGATSYEIKLPRLFRFDNGDMGVLCGHKPTVTVVVPAYVED